MRPLQYRDVTKKQLVNRIRCQHDMLQTRDAQIAIKDTQIAALVTAIETAREAIASLPIDALGSGHDGELEWPIRDELVHNLTKAIKEAANG